MISRGERLVTKRWRAILGIGIVALVAAAVALRPLRTARPPSDVLLDVQQDGSVEFRGTHFADMAQLQAALIDACAQRPRPMVRIRGDKSRTIDQVTAVMSIAGKADCLR